MVNRQVIKQHIALCVCALISCTCFAVDPQPRMWTHLPINHNFGGLAFASNDADIAFDPTLKLDNVEMSLDIAAGAYIRTFEMLGKTARFDITQTYMKGKWEGILDGEAASTSREGFGDTQLRFSTSLYGAPPLDGKEFGAYRAGANSETLIGAGVVVRLPTGNYDDGKLINLGQNRYVVRPQLGITHQMGKWATELTGEVALFGDNEEFYNGSTLGQKTLYVMHAHIIRNFNPGQWLALSVGYDYGGESRVNGVDKNDEKRDIGWLVSYVHPITRTTGLKVSYLNIDTKKDTGAHSNTLIASLAFAW